jgi:hypothetical protein
MARSVTRRAALNGQCGDHCGGSSRALGPVGRVVLLRALGRSLPGAQEFEPTRSPRASSPLPNSALQRTSGAATFGAPQPLAACAARR